MSPVVRAVECSLHDACVLLRKAIIMVSSPAENTTTVTPFPSARWIAGFSRTAVWEPSLLRPGVWPASSVHGEPPRCRCPGAGRLPGPRSALHHGRLKQNCDPERPKHSLAGSPQSSRPANIAPSPSVPFAKGLVAFLLEAPGDPKTDPGAGSSVLQGWMLRLQNSLLSGGREQLRALSHGGS